jgi:hypothetical protein
MLSINISPSRYSIFYSENDPIFIEKDLPTPLVYPPFPSYFYAS